MAEKEEKGTPSDNMSIWGGGDAGTQERQETKGMSVAGFNDEVKAEAVYNIDQPAYRYTNNVDTVTNYNGVINAGGVLGTAWAKAVEEDADISAIQKKNKEIDESSLSPFMKTFLKQKVRDDAFNSARPGTTNWKALTSYYTATYDNSNERKEFEQYKDFYLAYTGEAWDSNKMDADEMVAYCKDAASAMQRLKVYQSQIGITQGIQDERYLRNASKVLDNEKVAFGNHIKGFIEKFNKGALSETDLNNYYKEANSKIALMTSMGLHNFKQGEAYINAYKYIAETAYKYNTMTMAEKQQAVNFLHTFYNIGANGGDPSIANNMRATLGTKMANCLANAVHLGNLALKNEREWKETMQGVSLSNSRGKPNTIGQAVNSAASAINEASSTEYTQEQADSIVAQLTANSVTSPTLTTNAISKASNPIEFLKKVKYENYSTMKNNALVHTQAVYNAWIELGADRPELWSTKDGRITIKEGVRLTPKQRELLGAINNCNKTMLMFNAVDAGIDTTAKVRSNKALIEQSTYKFAKNLAWNKDLNRK